jgi:hypothetical protein
MKFGHLGIAGILALGSSFSHAATPVFFDDFNSYAMDQINWSPPASSGWIVSGGTVDLVGVGGAFDLVPGNGGYVDLDGSTGQAGQFSANVSLLGGVMYTLSFDLAGSHRGSSETVNVTFGSMAQSFSLASADPFSSHSLSFSPVTAGSYSFGYQNLGGHTIGILLDNVAVTAVPEPETYAMVFAGLGLVGWMAGRRKQSAG